MLTLKIAVRNIFRHRVRSLITLSTIIFGCMALIFVGGFFEDIFIQIREGFISAQSGHIQIFRRGYKESGRVEPFKHLIDNHVEITELVQRIQDVKFVTARLQFDGLISTGDNTVSFVGQGIQPENERSVPVEVEHDLKLSMSPEYYGLPAIESGLALAKEDVYETVLGKGLAETMGAKVGVPVVLLTNTVAGSTNALDLNIKGIFYTSAKEFDDVVLRVPLATAQSLLDTKSVQSIVIKLYRTEDTSKVYKILEQMIIDRKMDLELQRWEEVADYYRKTVELFNAFFMILRFIIGIVIIFGIFNTMNMAVMERFSEIGTIMALGTRPKGVMKLFLIEGLLLGLIGGALGIAAGSVIVSLISLVGIRMPPPPGGTFYWLAMPKVVPSILISTFFTSLFVGGISTIYPAYKASRLQITEALRYR